MFCTVSASRKWNSVSIPLLALIISASVSIACGRAPRDASDAGASSSAAAATASATATAAAARPAAAVATAPRPRIVMLGDSLTAGLGLAPGDAYPALLQKKIDRAGLNFEIVNAGVSGDTSAGGVRRLDWSLDGDVRILVLELGANDGLRGLSVKDMVANLSTIIERARARGIAVLLCGMEAPPNFGADYIREFHLAFPALAKKYQLPFVPFLLTGVAGTTEFNQSDGIHPNVEGARKVADTVWTALQPMLAAASSQTGASQTGASRTGASPTRGTS
jgi:acyl-CoA thioesterase I